MLDICVTTNVRNRLLLRGTSEHLNVIIDEERLDDGAWVGEACGLNDDGIPEHSTHAHVATEGFTVEQ